MGSTNNDVFLDNNYITVWNKDNSAITIRINLKL